MALCKHCLDCSKLTCVWVAAVPGDMLGPAGMRRYHRSYRLYLKCVAGFEETRVALPLLAGSALLASIVCLERKSTST